MSAPNEKKMFRCLTPPKIFYEFRQNQCTSLPTDWLAQNPSFSMYLKSSQTNQSYPYLPLVDSVDDEYDTKVHLPLPLPMPLHSEHAVSLHNLATDYEYDDKSPTLSASFILDNHIPSQYKRSSINLGTNLIDAVPVSSLSKRMRSPPELLTKFYSNRLSISGDDVSDVNVNEIGWKIPPKMSPKISHGNSRQKIDALKARKSIPNALKVMKASVPVYSQSALSIPQQRSLDEQQFRHSHSLLPQIRVLLNRKSIRKAFMKSRSFNSFENQLHSGGNQADNFESTSNRSVQKNETEIYVRSPTPSNRNILSLDIVKPFNEDDLRKVVDTTNIPLRKSSKESNTLQVPQKHNSFIASPAPLTDCQSEIVRQISRGNSPMHTPRVSPLPSPKILPQIPTKPSPMPSPNAPSKVLIKPSPAPSPIPSPSRSVPKQSPKPSPKPSSKVSPVHSPIETQKSIQEELKPKYKQYSELDKSQFNDNSAKERMGSDGKARIRRFRKLSHRNSERRKKEQQSSDAKTMAAEKPKANILKRASSFPDDDEDDDDDDLYENPSGETGSDDVFEPPAFEKSTKRAPQQRRSSSLENLSLFQAKQMLEKDIERGRSSVSINEKPEYFEYNHKSFVRGSKVHRSYPSIANRALNSPHKNKPNGIASLQMSPKRGLLKKSTPTTVNDVPSNNSDTYMDREREQERGYERGSASTIINNRDRDRATSGQQGLSRDLYRNRMDREPSRSLSDRDGREQDSFNRSLSTNEGTPDDKIGNYYH